MDVESALPIASVDEWERWLADHHERESDVWIGIFKKASGKQTVAFADLLEAGFCWGWVDVKTKAIDTERYGIQFYRRKPGSNWSARNREVVCRLISDGRMRPAGTALLPTDLVCK